MFKSLSEMKHHLGEIEKSVLDQSQTLRSMHWDLHRLRRENDDFRSWNSKLKSKNSALRKERRRLRQLLEDHGIAHDSETFHEKRLA